MVKKYFWRKSNGKPYLRVRGRFYPLRDKRGNWHELDTPAGDQLYWEILSGQQSISSSWEKLIVSYRLSDRWEKLKPRTRSDYEKVLIYLEEKIGKRGVMLLTRKDVIAAQTANKHRVRFANYIPQVMSVLCEHSIDLGWRADNPAKGVRKLVVPSDRRQQHIPWPDWAVEKFREQASPRARLIFELGIGSVQRPDDWTRFRWNDYDGRSLRVTQSKTDVELKLPCTPQLKAALDAAERKGLTILTLTDGRPLAYRRMADLMRKERVRLGVEAYDLHALRYRGVMELAWAGCSDEEIASFSGHASLDMIRKYAGKARQETRAMRAVQKRTENKK